MKKKISFSLLAICICLTYTVNAQDFNYPKLTKEQMSDDFDNMIQIIKDCNAQLNAKKIVTGIDNLSEMQKMKNNIDTVSNTESFYRLINKTLYLLYDNNVSPFVNYAAENVKDIDNDYLIKYNEYLKEQSSMHYYMSTIDSASVAIPLEFFDNNYYIIGNNVFDNKNPKKEKLKTNIMKVISIDGVPIDSYIEKFLSEQPYRAIWDFTYKKFIPNFAYLPSKGKVKVEQDNKKFEFNIEDYNIYTWSSNLSDNNMELSNMRIDQKDFIQFFEKESTLYIYPFYLEALFNSEIDFSKLLDEILNIGRKENIQKIIIDIRSSAFSERMLIKILEKIIKNPIKYKTEIAYNNTEIMRKYYGDDLSKERTIKYLDNQNLRVIENIKTIFPDQNSLKFDGKIYFLTSNHTNKDCLSFTQICKSEDNLISVGPSQNSFSGKEPKTRLFQLKNSKYTFSVPTIIDISNCYNAEDIWHAKQEETVNISFDEYLIFQHNKNISEKISDKASLQKFLLKYDTILRKVLEMK